MTASADTSSSTARDKLAAELESVRREFRIINLCVAGIALGVMIYGAGNTNGLLINHAVPSSIAWILSPMVDAGLCVGLVATRGLTRYGIEAGWVGALRWITAGMTWGLNIASPLSHSGGPDWLGVFIHSIGPALLLFVVEAAAYYLHRMGKVITTKQHALEDAEAASRADRAERAAVAQQVRQLTTDHATALARTEQLAEQLAAINAERDTERASALRAVHLAEQETERLRTTLTAEAENLRAGWAEKIEAVSAQHAEEIERMRAETSTVSLTAYRNTHQRGGSASQRRSAAEKRDVPANAARMSDEEAVQALFDTGRGPDHQWTQPEVREVTGAGYGRIPKLLSALAEFHQSRAAENGGRTERRTAGQTTESLSDDAKEDTCDDQRASA